MGIHDRQYYRDDSQGFSLASLTGGRSIVFILIAINVAVFLVDAMFPSYGQTGRASEFLKLSSTDLVNPLMWWRFLTCGFAHGSPSHLIGNMIGLFFFGRAAEAVYGSKKFLWLYLTAILAGSLAWMAMTTATGSRGAVLGASGGVVAVVILFCLNFPHQKIRLLIMPFVGIPAWVIGVVYVGGDLFGALGFRPDSNVAFAVHLTGAAYAYLFYRTKWELSELIPGLGSGKFSIPNPMKRQPDLRVHRPPTDNRHEKLATKADEILQKLHQHGEGSLSARERKILEDYSRSIKQKNS